MDVYYVYAWLGACHMHMAVTASLNESYLEEFSLPQVNMWALLSARVPSMSGRTKWTPPCGFSSENSIAIRKGRSSAYDHQKTLLRLVHAPTVKSFKSRQAWDWAHCMNTESSGWFSYRAASVYLTNIMTLTCYLRISSSSSSSIILLICHPASSMFQKWYGSITPTSRSRLTASRVYMKRFLFQIFILRVTSLS